MFIIYNRYNGGECYILGGCSLEVEGQAWSVCWLECSESIWLVPGTWVER